MAIPLYILSVPLKEGLLNVKLLICQLIINVGMIQSAIPFEKYSTSVNGVSWFISTIFIIIPPRDVVKKKEEFFNQSFPIYLSYT
jgi:hypothetical protein